jgi:hypothetical protein
VRRRKSWRLIQIEITWIGASAAGFDWRGIGKLAGLRTIRQAPPSSLGVQGTPTLLLVNKEGVITSSWRGKLPSEKELEVMARL